MSKFQSLSQFLALNRTVAVVLTAVLFFGLGEELWRSFMPAYLKAGSKEVSALWTIGVYACVLNLFEAGCYIMGGRLTARLGDRGSLMLFALLSITGYALFLSLGTPWAAIIAALLILGWEPLSVPVTFTTVGSTVESKRQGMAFALQSIQKRLPKILGPLIAGFVLGSTTTQHGQSQGILIGFHWLVGLALVLGVLSLVIQFIWMPKRKSTVIDVPARAILGGMHPTLRRLLMAEILTRWCDWLVREFVVVYLLVVRGVPVQQVGMLIATQNIVALLTYLPIGRLTQRVGLQPFIGLTFVFFALFPLVLALIPDGNWLYLAFVVYGLREVGEPARKALITSLFPDTIRARGVGLYWGVRSLCICTAPLAGAWLWYSFGPTILFLAAFGMGCLGAFAFYATVPKPERDPAT